MGYVSATTSGSTSTFRLYWTEKGREYLSRLNPDKDGLRVQYFGLGDSDVNYYVANTSDLEDFIPNIGGIDTILCTRGTKQQDIKYKIESGYDGILAQVTSTNTIGGLNNGTITVGPIEGGTNDSYIVSLSTGTNIINTINLNMGEVGTFSGLATGTYNVDIEDINDSSLNKRFVITIT